jgi:hypothetical protein
VLFAQSDARRRQSVGATDSLRHFDSTEGSPALCQDRGDNTARALVSVLSYVPDEPELMEGCFWLHSVPRRS